MSHTGRTHHDRCDGSTRKAPRYIRNCKTDATELQALGARASIIHLTAATKPEIVY